MFYLPQDIGYVNRKYDVTNIEFENILREQDVVGEGELETNRCDAELEEFCLSHPPRVWREAKRNFEKLVALCSQTSRSFNVTLSYEKIASIKMYSVKKLYLTL